MEDMLRRSESLQEALVKHRRWLHANAEVGFNIPKTLDYVKNALMEMGCDVHSCGKAGLTATITGNKAGKTILLRADMDALPIREEADVPFPCPDGAMHACGHDMHTTMLLGAAQLLMAHKDSLHGNVKLMFQPAEEIFEGAKDMIENGVLENVDAAMMIHVTAGMPLSAGTVIVSAPGVSAPAADYFTIEVQGKGCHGSAPQNGIDALTAAAHILIALQEINARELSAAQEAVLTIGTIRGGSAANAIADKAVLQGTIRTYDEKTRRFVKSRLEEISCAIATAFRANAEVSFGSGCPTLVNDKDLCEKLHGYLKELLGAQKALSAAQFGSSRGGGSEDFAYVSQQIPSVMLALSAGEPAKGYEYSQHHPKVRFDESVLSVGAAVFAQCAICFLNEDN